MLYLEGPLGSGKSTRLLIEVNTMLNSQPASGLLVLCSNHFRQRAFIEQLLTLHGKPLAQLPVYTYAGFVRNALFNYWPLVEAEISASLKRGAPCVRPELSGLEDSELILKWLLGRLRKEAAEKGQEVFPDFPGSDAHILKQIVRRLRLRSENQLTRPQMTERSMLLKEEAIPETAWLEKQFDVESYVLRVLDANKQLDVFHRLLKGENAFSNALRNDIKMLVVDDVDETTAAQQQFIQWLAPSVETLMMAADVDGGSRRGYLNAYPYDWRALKRLRTHDALVDMETVQLQRMDASAIAAQTLLNNWKRTEAFDTLPPMVRIVETTITRVEMLERVVRDIETALLEGASPGDICIVLPKADFLGFYQIQKSLYQSGIPVQLLSGTKRPSDNPLCKAFIYMLQWANSKTWGVRLSPWEVKTVFIHGLRLHQNPLLQADALEALFRAVHTWHWKESATGEALMPSLDELQTLLPDFALDAETLARYALLAGWLDAAQTLSFDKQLYIAFNDLIAPFSEESQGYGDINRIIESYLRQRTMYLGYMRYNAPSSEESPSPEEADAIATPSLSLIQEFNQWWLEQVKTGVVADTPEMPEAVNPDAVVIATPQKVIDTELRRISQYWLDASSRQWARSDNAPLYNAWVHSAVWDGSNTAFSEEFSEAVIRTRAGHITRTLMLLATESVRIYASELDDLGMPQEGLLQERLPVPVEAGVSRVFERATLRPDQAPILRYTGGTMAISAVPGAGKTFVNVELLLELIDRGVQPDRILVLTYMDSAARTLLGRLKKKLAGHTRKLPVVSTIHSLALRILSDSDHAVLAGYLPDDLKMLDEFEKNELITRIALATQPESTKSLGNWQSAISRAIGHAKMFRISTEQINAFYQTMPNNFRLAEFLPAYRAYQTELRRLGMLDFTDLITEAVRILETFPEVRQKYQRQFEYVIEDEAQDSSRLLQRFIGLLGHPESPNLIRTGDTNQSITTTFSSADTSVFRAFILSAGTQVRMDASGRCAPEVMNLANRWIALATETPGLEKAFEPVDMQPVPGQNPALRYPLAAGLFEQEATEEAWLLARIQEIRAEVEGGNPCSIAVLARSKAQVNKVTALLQQAGLPAIGFSDQNQHPVFTILLAYLKLLSEPGNLHFQFQWYQLMLSAQMIPESGVVEEWMASVPLLYQDPATLPDAWLKQWYYDLMEFTQQAAGGSMNTLIARITDRLCESVGDRSHGYLCALMAQDMLEASDSLAHLSPLEIVIKQFEAFQRSWKGRKGFGDVMAAHADQVIQVMTMHKSKGQEFDVVFMPFLQADSFPHAADAIRFDESDKLMQELDRCLLAGEKQSLSQAYMEDKKREKIEEEARLIYVGLTRARKGLYLTAHRNAINRYNKSRSVESALAFRLLAPMLENLQPSENSVDALVEVKK